MSQQEINLYQIKDYYQEPTNTNNNGNDALSEFNRSSSLCQMDFFNDFLTPPIDEIGQSTCQEVGLQSIEQFLMPPQFQFQDEYKQQNNDTDDTLEIYQPFDNNIFNLKGCLIPTPTQNSPQANLATYYDNDDNNNNNLNFISDITKTIFYNNNNIADYNDEIAIYDINNNSNISINADYQPNSKLIFSNKRCNQINSKQKYKEKFVGETRQRKAMKRKDELQIQVRDNDNAQAQIQAVCRARLIKNNIRYIMNKGIRSIRNINKEYYRSLCSKCGLSEDAIATTIYGYLDKSIEFLKKQWLSPSKENIVFRKLSYYYLHKQAIRGILNGKMKNKILYLQSLDLLKESVKNPQILEQGNFPKQP